MRRRARSCMIGYPRGRIAPGLSLAAALLATIFTASCSRRQEADPRIVSEWMRTLYGVIRVERISPPVASRLLAYATTALYSGLAAADSTMPPLTGALNGFPDLPRGNPGTRYDAVLTAVAAERMVLDSLLVEALPTTRAAVARLADSLDQVRAADVGGEIGSRSTDLGRRVGAGIVAWARADGFDSTRNRAYIPPAGPGLWVNDAPGSTYATQNLSGATQFVALDNPANLLRSGNASDRGLILDRPKRAGLATLPSVNIAGTSEPYWGQVRPFVLRRWDECSVPPPLPYSTQPQSAFHADARSTHETALRLTADQRTMALYWADNAGESGTPPGHWIAIASQIASRRGLAASQAARLMVLTAAAQADAFIASWGYKYRYNSVRPRPYIRSMIDSTWEPLIPTPPFPEYPSGHSTQSAAAAAVIAALVGDVAFDDSTGLAIGHDVRRFTSFSAAADEAGMSRVYAGIHFPAANAGGKALGQCVGAKVLERLHLPVRP